MVFQMAPSLQVSQPKLCTHFSSVPCPMSSTTHPPSFGGPNNYWFAVQILKFLITLFSLHHPVTSFLSGPTRSSAPCSENTTIYIPLLTSQDKFHANIVRLAKLQCHIY